MAMMSHRLQQVYSSWQDPVKQSVRPSVRLPSSSHKLRNGKTSSMKKVKADVNGFVPSADKETYTSQNVHDEAVSVCHPHETVVITD
jgi:hypothetical protein